MNWKRVPLKRIAKVLNGYAFKSSEYVSSGIKILRIGNVQKGKIVDDDPQFVAIDRQREFERFMLAEGDILISLTGNVGRVGVLEKKLLPAALNQRVGALKFHDNSILPSFVYSLLNSDQFERDAIYNSNGIAQLNLSSRWIENYEVPIPHKNGKPDLEEQKRIAAILDKADAIRRKRQQALRLTDDFLRSLFLDMFGDPVTNPKGWETYPLSELGTLDRGISKHRPRNEPALLGGAYPLVQTGDVANSGGYIRRHGSTYSELGLRQSKLWPKGTLCITIAANIANTGILTYDACFPDSVVGFIPNENSTVEFVQGLFWFFRKILDDGATQVAQKNINLRVLRELPVPRPNKALQVAFSEAVKRANALISSTYSLSNGSEKLFSSLQQRAFRGEL